MLDGLTVVPGRDCGDCTLCCSVLLIDTPQIQKQVGTACRHCSGGCTIYQTRPEACREFLCAWRKLDILGPEWRPDLSGILAQIETEDIPAASGFAAGIGLMLVDNPLKTLRQKFFLDFVTMGIVSDIPLFLSLPGPPGHQAAKVLLNTAEMRQAAGSGKSEPVKNLLEAALRDLRAHNFQPYTLVHGGNDTGV
jgi:hypothetical protein